MRVQTIRDVAASARGRRLGLHLTQVEVAERAGVSRAWISAFEAGKPSVELALALRVLDVVGLRVDVSAEVATAPKHMRCGTSPAGVTDLDELLANHRGR